MTKRKMPTAKQGSFDLPRNPWQSTQGARNAYSAMWGHEWPEDDDYLRLLASRIPKSTPGFSCCDTLLMAMRENDPTDGP